MTVASSHLSVVNTSPRLSKLSNIFVTSSSKIINLDVFSSMGGISHRQYRHLHSDGCDTITHVTTIHVDALGLPLVGKNWVDPPTTRKIGLTPCLPPLFAPKIVDFVNFMQFLAILSRLSPTNRPHLGNPV